MTTYGTDTFIATTFWTALIAEAATGEVLRHELLLRMVAEDGSLIPPGAFLPAAEKHGAIRDIDRWVLAPED